MSRIDELIERLCPDGVEFRELAQLTRPVETIRWSQNTGTEFEYIDLTSVDITAHSITKTQTIDSKTAPSRAQQIVHKDDIIFGTTRPTLMRYCAIGSVHNGSICSTGYCVLRPKTDEIIPHFLLHVISSDRFGAFVESNQQGASYPSISDRAVKRFRLPVPPVEVQREIVRVLDLFTGLEAELEAELEARRKQYEYYRDQLLTFSEERERERES